MYTLWKGASGLRRRRTTLISHRIPSCLPKRLTTHLQTQKRGWNHTLTTKRWRPPTLR